MDDMYCEGHVCCLRKHEEILERICVIHEKMLFEHRAEMAMIKEWLKSMKEDKKHMTNTIKNMSDVLSEKLSPSPGDVVNIGVPPVANTNCQYAGVYFVHN